MTETHLRSTSRRRFAAEERRTQLLAVALRLFADRGYDGTTTRDIAEAAGVAEGLLFRHFGTKREILRAVLEQHSPRSHLMRLAPQLEGMSVRDALLMLYTQMVDGLWEHRLFVRLILTESNKPGEACQEFCALMEEGPRFIAAFFQCRIERGELRPFSADAGAAVLGGAIFSYFMRYHYLPPETGRPMCQKFVTECVDLFLNGALGPDGCGGGADPARAMTNDEERE